MRNLETIRLPDTHICPLSNADAEVYRAINLGPAGSLGWTSRVDGQAMIWFHAEG